MICVVICVDFLSHFLRIVFLFYMLLTITRYVLYRNVSQFSHGLMFEFEFYQMNYKLIR